MKKYIKILISLSSLLSIFLLPVFIIVWQSNIFLPQTSIYEIPKMSDEDYRKYQSQTIDFLLNKGQLPDQMTENEISHMEDVKKVFIISMVVLIISIILVVFLKFKTKKEYFMQALKESSILAFLIIILLLILSLFNFEILFIYFHKIFFPQGNWLFPVNSTMIQVFPESLFKKLAFYSFTISGLFAFLIFLKKK